MVNQPPIGLDDAPLLELHQALRQAWGIDFRRLRTLICGLSDGSWQTISNLVQLSTLSHRTVTNLVRRLSPWLEEEEERVRLRPESAPSFRDLFTCEQLSQPRFPDPYEVAAGAHPALPEIEQILANAPRSDRNLDHVSATPLTCLKRALFLADCCDLDGAEILCLGDHDLTSVALALLFPDLTISVLDVDERILGYIGTLARDRDWSIQTTFADLRVELPRSMSERFDLVFTDPPYTPAGIELFLKRGIASLRDPRVGRLFLCYGFGEGHPGLGLKVQSVLHDLRLISEAVLPHFNRYTGAEAIGSASELYICRPTRRSSSAANAVGADAHIYTQGKSSEEGEKKIINPEILSAVEQRLSTFESSKLTCVGDGWPTENFSPTHATSLGGFLQTMYLGAGKPPFTQLPHSGTVVANLYPHYGSYLPRVLLAAAAEHLVICAPDRDLHHIFVSDAGKPLLPLMESAYRSVVLRRGDDELPGFVVLERIPPPEAPGLPFLLRYLADRRRAKLGNAWREGLIAWRQKSAAPRLTKNQARELIAVSGYPTVHLQGHLSELPEHALQAVVQTSRQILDADLSESTEQSR
ncbi:MAG: bis-aminopropyl spermidine synthase family protein [Gemmatimonadetes bacterium]|nr:bis-aminopropyl spermidine synthase family protein [Gemmatimonadota bacterium]